MKIFNKTKKIILIWDYDAPIGQINATFPYNFDYNTLNKEKSNVEYALSKMEEYSIKSCFAITGFSAEQGSLPFNFPDFIDHISKKGHEIASHNWKHEWIPFFTEKQNRKSFERSKLALERSIKHRQEVIGFCPPHSKPSTWIRKGAFSLGDRALWPFFKMANLENVLKLLNELNYKWIRISLNSIKYKTGFKNKNLTGKVYKYKNMLILENFYTGFDNIVQEYILHSTNEYYIITAHPAMLSKDKNKMESSMYFEDFLNKFANNSEYEFISPMDLINHNI